MSSDTFRYRIDAVEGRDVRLTVKPTTAAGFCDRPMTRSFVSLLLAEHGGPPTIDEALDVKWLEQHLDELVSEIVIESVVGLTHEGILRNMALTLQIPVEHLQPVFTLKATMASEALAKRFEVAAWTGTTAFDVWGGDPKSASMPTQVGDVEPFVAHVNASAQASSAMPAHLGRWKTDPILGLHRETPNARLRVWFYDGTLEVRPGFTANVVLEVPAMRAVGGTKRGEVVPQWLVVGTLRPRSAPYWFRQFLGDEDAPPQLVYFVGEPGVEELDATYARLARTLDATQVDVMLTREGVIALVEDLVAARPPKERPSNHERLGNGTAPALPPEWVWSYDANLLWMRIAMHAALGARADANAALAQARAKSKKPPKELKALIAALDAEG